MTHFEECEFRVYRADGNEVVAFQPSGQPFDWRTEGFYPATVFNSTPTSDGRVDFPKESKPLAFFTGHASIPMDPTEHAAAAVCVSVDSKPSHTYVAARNSDCAYGRILLHGFGIVETPGRKTTNQLYNLQVGTLPPRVFNPSCIVGDWVDWPPLLVQNTNPTMRVLGAFAVGGLTATASGFPNGLHACAPVGVMRVKTLADDSVSFQPQTELRVFARNSDVAFGLAGMNYLIASAGGTQNSEGALWVDTGRVAQRLFLQSGIVGDWMMPAESVKFNGAFAEPPTVFVSPNADGAQGHIAAPVPIVDNVTTTGFTLLARNTDSVFGTSAFHWVAFGRARKG